MTYVSKNFNNITIFGIVRRHWKYKINGKKLLIFFYNNNLFEYKFNITSNYKFMWEYMNINY